MPTNCNRSSNGANTIDIFITREYRKSNMHTHQIQNLPLSLPNTITIFETLA